MKGTEMKNFKKGQTVLVGKIGEGKFEVAELDKILFRFTNWDKIDMNKGTIKRVEGGSVELDNLNDSWMNVLNSEELKKVSKIKNKIKMLEGLEEDKKN